MQIPSVSLLANGLSQRVDVTVIPLRNPASIEHRQHSKIDVLDPGGATLQFRAMLARAIAAVRKRHNAKSFDLLHGYWLFEPGIVAIAAGRAIGVPVVASIGGAELISLPVLGYGGMRSRRGRILNHAVLRAATLVTGGSSYVLDLARRASPVCAPRLRLTPLPIQVALENETIENPFVEEASINLLQVGAYLPVKGQDLSIRALTALLNADARFQLTLVGENPHGYKERMIHLARSLGIAERVQFLDRVPHEALARYYDHSDLLLMPSRHESQGMVVLEAAALGLPTVGSDVGVVRDLAPDAAVAVPVDNLAAFAQAIATLADDPGGRRTLGETARAEMRRAYDLRPVVERWIGNYEEALDR